MSLIKNIVCVVDKKVHASAFQGMGTVPRVQDGREGMREDRGGGEGAGGAGDAGEEGLEKEGGGPGDVL